MGTDSPRTWLGNWKHSNNHQHRWYDNVNDMLKICIVSILFINFAACSLERGVVVIRAWYQMSGNTLVERSKVKLYVVKSGQ